MLGQLENMPDVNHSMSLDVEPVVEIQVDASINVDPNETLEIEVEPPEILADISYYAAHNTELQNDPQLVESSYQVDPNLKPDIEFPTEVVVQVPPMQDLALENNTHEKFLQFQTDRAKAKIPDYAPKREMSLLIQSKLFNNNNFIV